MKPINKWKREWFTRDMPLGEGTPLTASFELYDSGVIGIHLACCFDGAMILKDALRIIVHFRSRTEYDETGKGIYILVKGEMPYFDGFEGLKIDTYYLTGRTIVYDEIIENQEALEWFLTEYDETGKGIYILVKGEMPYFDGFEGLKIDTYYLTGRTIVYDKIIENQEALEWFLKEYGFFLRDLPDMYDDTKYYRQVTMDGDVLKITVQNIKKGTRHKTLLSYGGRLLSEGYSMDHVEVKMYDFNMLYCVPPLQYSEFEVIVRSVKKYSQERDGEKK